MTLAAIVVFVTGLWILAGACSFASRAMPPPALVAEYRVVFYQRSGLGVGCILLGIVLLRLRPTGQADTKPEEPGHDAQAR